MEKSSRVMAFAVVIALGFGAVGAQVMTATNPGSTVVDTSTDARVFTRGFCKFGMQFLAATLAKTHSNASSGVTVVQVFLGNGKPMECREDAK